MSVQSVVSQAGYLMEGSLGIWFASWAVRRKGKWDYRLSAAAEVTRWGAALGGYILAASLPTPALRLTAGFTGLAFLCWPNLAYHLANLFSNRSMLVVQGGVTSVAYEGPRASLGYSFTYGGARFGGTASVKRRASSADWAPGDLINVTFDPANPEKSKLSTTPPAPPLH
jgi:hypothetical protein